MASLDQLSPDRRAIIELVLARGQSYGDLSGTLGLPESRVREYAREALATLAPRSAERVDPHWRGQVADYLLGQQGGPQAKATRSHLRSSEAARGWAMSVLDSVGHLYPDGAEPPIPRAGRAGAEEPPAAAAVGERERREGRAAEAPPARRSRPRSERTSDPSADRATVRRRRIAAAIGALAVLAALVVLATQLLGGDDGESGADEADAAAEEAAAAQPEVRATLQLRPVGGGQGAGGAIVAEQDGQPILLLRAKLPPVGNDETYVVWLYNDTQDAAPVAVPQVDRQGNLQVIAPLPAEFEQYGAIDVSLQQRTDRAQHSGQSVLRASLAGAEGGEGATGATPEVPELPAPEGG